MHAGSEQRGPQPNERSHRRGSWRNAVAVAVSLAAAIAPVHTASAAAGTTGLHSCRPDQRRYCNDMGRTGAVGTACLHQYYVNLSHNCRAALDARHSSGDQPDDADSTQ